MSLTLVPGPVRRAITIGAGLLALLCAPSAHAATAGVLSPLNAGSISSPAASHLISFDGDYAMDIAGGGDVYARLSSASGVSLRVEQIGGACAGGRQGGSAVRVRVYLDGASVGLLVYVHLADVAVSVGQTIGNGTRLGRAATGLPVNDLCWTGTHVHLEVRNDSGYACFTPLGAGAGVNAGTAVGQMGTVGAGGKRTPCGSPPPAGGANPLGAYDLAESPTPGAVRVAGWSFDPDARTSPTEVHVYLGGQAGQTGVEGRAFVANASRPDVAAVHSGVGNNHGFDQTFETGRRGNQPVCVYAITIGAGSNVLLGCRMVNIADPNPLGAYDEAISPEPGVLRVRGWTFDPNARTAPLDVHVYVGAEAGQPGAEFHAFRADASRPDVAAVHGGVGNAHGVDRTFVTAKRGSQKVCLYAINTGPGGNVALGCKVVSIAAPVTTPRPAPLTDVVPADPPAAPAPAAGPNPGASPPPAPAGSAAPGAPSTPKAAAFPATVSRRAKLRVVVTGLPRGSRIVVRFKRSGRTTKRVGNVVGGRVLVRPPSRRGTYEVRVTSGGMLLAKRKLKVR